jgi:hypothetical protein
MTEMTTTTLLGNDCGCGPRLGTGQSSLEIGIDICCEKTQGFFDDLWMAIKRPFVGLFSFDAAVGGSWITSTPDKTVCNEFQSRREEARARWMSLSTANLSDSDLPAENLIDLDSRYLVRNEDYRISVAQGLGQPYIDAETMRMHNQKMWF